MLRFHDSLYYLKIHEQKVYKFCYHSTIEIPKVAQLRIRHLDMQGQCTVWQHRGNDKTNRTVLSISLQNTIFHLRAN